MSGIQERGRLNRQQLHCAPGFDSLELLVLPEAAPKSNVLSVLPFQVQFNEVHGHQ